MNRKFLAWAGLALLLVVTFVWWMTRSSSSANHQAVGSITPGADSGAGNPTGADLAGTASAQVAMQLENFRIKLAAAKDASESRRILAELRHFLSTLPPAIASREIQTFLAGAQDAPTHLQVTIEAGGGLGDASSLRVFLLDYIGRIDRQVAGSIATQILSGYTSPDEWTVSLRNYAWANPGPAGDAYLQEKARQLLANPAWLSNPSAGFLEAFDTIVYAHGTTLLPELATLVRDPENRAAAHAAYLTLDRLTMNDPAVMLQQLVGQPALMSGREPTRANLVARADVRDPAQRAWVEAYLLDPTRSMAELATFAAIYPNANFMVSDNLLTKVETPQGVQLAAHDRAALQVIEQWLGDPRFAHLQPVLATMHARVTAFVRQAKSGSSGGP